MASSIRHTLYILFALFLALNIVCWLQIRTVKAKWLNVPPVPTEQQAGAFGLADGQLFYRMVGLMLQNLGNTGGNSEPLKNYDYNRLTKWFYLADTFDNRSSFVALIAGFYFGAVEDPEKIKPLAQYLHDTGNSAYGQRWRWLAHAIYLERYKVNNLDKAYEWSLELANMDKPDMPMWTKQMPAFIKGAQGDKQAAYDILVEIMKTGKGKIIPAEMLVMKDYICKRILDKEKAAKDPLCQNYE